jgi:hypothetical protein
LVRTGLPVLYAFNFYRQLSSLAKSRVDIANSFESALLAF